MDGLPNSDSVLTSGQDTTAATGDQTTTADTAAKADGATTTVDKTAADTAAAKTEGDGKTTEEGTKTEAAKDGDKPAGAPEAYESFTVPEGFELDEQLLGEFTPVLKDLNLSQEAAQKLVDFAPKLVEKTVAQTQTAVLTQLGLADHASWAAALKADAEIGGEKLPENLGLAKKAFSAFFSPNAQKLINGLGLGNHPELIRSLVNVGKAISEDGFVPGGKTTTPMTAQGLYDKSNMNP